MPRAVFWVGVESEALTAIAYDPKEAAIYARFHTGAEWRYRSCTPEEWELFADPGTSKGAFLNDVLKLKPSDQLS